MRYSFEAVDDVLRVSVLELERRLDVAHGSVHRWRERGMNATSAERVAEALGYLPFELWPEMLDAAVAAVQKECVRCGRSFLPNRSFQKYCRASCREATFIAARPKKTVSGERDCEWCGTTFMSIRANHRRCSAACNRAARYAVHAEAERAYQRQYNAAWRARKRAA